MSDNCCTTTEAGNAVCAYPASGQVGTCACVSGDQSKSPAVVSILSTMVATSILTQSALPPNEAGIQKEEITMWQKIRGGLLFGVACLTSPCCTPLYIPLALALLAGTPAALWLGHNLGWVYGGLTLISVASLVVALRWLNQNKARQKPTPADPTQKSIASATPVVPPTKLQNN